MNIVKMPPRTEQEPDPAVIKRMQMLLDNAKAGELNQLAFVSVCTDGSILECLTPGDNVYELLGALKVLEYRITDCLKGSTQDTVYE